MGTVLFDNQIKTVIEEQSVGGQVYSDSINLEMCEHICFVIQNEVQVLAEVEFDDTDIVGDKIFVFPHPYVNGTKVRFTTTGTLPTGLSLATDYYLTNVNGFGFEVASSKANAIAGTNIEFSGGSGTHTVVPQAYSTLNCVLEAAIEPDVWAELSASLVQSSKTENLIYELNNPVYKFIRMKCTIESGQSVLIVKCLMKGHGY